MIARLDGFYKGLSANLLRNQNCQFLCPTGYSQRLFSFALRRKDAEFAEGFLVVLVGR